MDTEDDHNSSSEHTSERTSDKSISLEEMKCKIPNKLLVPKQSISSANPNVATILFHVADGYCFRNTLGVMKKEIDNTTMIFRQKEIEISFLNESKCAIHNIILDATELTCYKFNMRDQDDNIMEEHHISFNTDEFLKKTRGVGRRDGLRIFWFAGESKFNVQPIKSNNKESRRIGALFVKIINSEYTRYMIPNDFPEEPNLKASVKEFTELIGQADTTKCTSVELIGHELGLSIRGILPNNEISFFETLTHSNEEDPDIDDISDLINSPDAVIVKVPICTVKALSKFHNISQLSTVLRFYYGDKLPIKIESPISNYGTYTICLRNVKS